MRIAGNNKVGVSHPLASVEFNKNEPGCSPPPGSPATLAVTRICKTCGIEKPITDYYRDYRFPTRRELTCKKCRYKKKQREQPIKVCLTCPLHKCIEEYDNRELDLSTISRVAVARAVHCVPEHISQVFLGKTVCSMALAYDIAHHLGVTLDAFYQAIAGANGKNPARHYRYTGRVLTPPKYSVEGKGYPNLREALSALGIVSYTATHYDILPEEVKAHITRNRACRGR